MSQADRATESTPTNQQRLMRDLLGLMALPAYWNGQEPRFVFKTLFEALESLLDLDVCYGVTRLGGMPLAMLRVARRERAPDDPLWAPIAGFAATAQGTEAVAEHTLLPGLDAVRLVRLPIGYVGEAGEIVLGSSRRSFPDPTERTTLQAAVSLAASGLETSRLLRERDDAQRAKDDFLAMLGHELRNPLAPIVTALRLMRMRAAGPGTREQEIIERQVGHLRALVDDLLDVSRITQGKLELRKEVVDLADMLHRALETVAPVVAERQHRLHLDIAPALMVEGDPVRLVQAFANLLTNAAKYTAPGGIISVRARQEGEHIHAQVADNGAGIAPELLPKLFDLFVQGATTRARSQGGLGIGLTIVHRLVQMHGGAVTARSAGPGCGSEFSVTLPVRRCALAAARAPASPAIGVAAARETVLVVDDNEDAAELASAILELAGFAVHVAHSCIEALDRAVQFKPTVVLLDIDLPDLDGYSVAAALRSRLEPAIPRFIALTGYGQTHDHERSRQAGFMAHLVKPVDPERLVATIEASRPAAQASHRSETT